MMSRERRRERSKDMRRKLQERQGERRPMTNNYYVKEHTYCLF